FFADLEVEFAGTPRPLFFQLLQARLKFIVCGFRHFSSWPQFCAGTDCTPHEASFARVSGMACLPIYKGQRCSPESPTLRSEKWHQVNWPLDPEASKAKILILDYLNVGSKAPTS